MWGNLWSVISGIFLLAAIVLGYLRFGKKKKQYTMYFVCALLLSFGAGFMSVWPTSGIVALVLGAACIVPAVLLLYKRFQRIRGAKDGDTSNPLPTQPTVPTRIPYIQKTGQISASEVVVPQWKDGCEKKYYYQVKINLKDRGHLLEALQKGDHTLTATVDGAEVHIYSDGSDVGTLSERTDMMIDWIKREEPYFLAVKRLEDVREQDCTAMLAFYRDRRKGQEKREQTVVALVNYKARSRQENLESSSLREGSELELEEDYESEGKMWVTYRGMPIGQLPAKLLRKYEEEDWYGIFLERLEDDDTSTEYVQKPIVRIYW